MVVDAASAPRGQLLLFAQLFPKLLSATGLSLSSLSSHPALVRVSSLSLLHCPQGPVGATEACVRQTEEPGRAVLSQSGGNAVKAIRRCKFSAKSVPERSVTVTPVTAPLLDGLTAGGFTVAACYPKADHLMRCIQSVGQTLRWHAPCHNDLSAVVQT